jgi:hypothetical protein
MKNILLTALIWILFISNCKKEPIKKVEQNYQFPLNSIISEFDKQSKGVYQMSRYQNISRFLGFEYNPKRNNDKEDHYCGEFDPENKTFELMFFGLEEKRKFTFTKIGEDFFKESGEQLSLHTINLGSKTLMLALSKYKDRDINLILFDNLLPNQIELTENRWDTKNKSLSGGFRYQKNFAECLKDTGERFDRDQDYSKPPDSEL